jgi:hypothetical protein
MRHQVSNYKPGKKNQNEQGSYYNKGCDYAPVVGFPKLVSTVSFIAAIEYDVQYIGAKYFICFHLLCLSLIIYS